MYTHIGTPGINWTKQGYRAGTTRYPKNHACDARGVALCGIKVGTQHSHLQDETFDRLTSLDSQFLGNRKVTCEKCAAIITKETK